MVDCSTVTRQKLLQLCFFMLNTVKNWWQHVVIVADEAATFARSASGRQNSGRPADRSLLLDELEPRVLFSATPIDPAMMAEEQPAMVVEVDAAEGDNSNLENLDEASASQSHSEIIIIDGSVPDLQQFLDDLSRSGREADVFVLDTDRDGIDQITEILDGRTGIDSLHIVSHGDVGEVTLGSTKLTQDTLAGYAGQIASWQDGFSADADILFYGCDLAGDESGRGFVESIAALTGTDVAASDDLTGHDSLGGDWELEYGVGVIDTNVAFSEEFRNEWFALLTTNLAPINVTPAAGHADTDTRLVFSAATGNGIRVFDQDAAGGNLLVTASVTNGTLDLGDPNAAAVLTQNASDFQIEGTLSEINAALDGLTFTPTAGFAGSAELTLLTDDQGNSGTGGALQDSDTIAIRVGQELVATDAFRINPESPTDPTDGEETTDGGSRGRNDAVAVHDDGTYVVVWTDDSRINGQDIFAHRYNADGVLIQSILVNSNQDGDQRQANVAMDAQGRFAVVWTTDHNGTNDIYMRRFNADGSPIDNQDVLVNTTGVDGDQNQPSIAVNEAGQIFVAWEGDGANEGIYLNEFDLSGGNGVGEIQVTSANNARHVDLSANNNGDVVVVWQQDGIYRQRFGSQADAGPQQIADAFTNSRNPTVVYLDDGRFIVAWDSAFAFGRGLELQMFDSTGTPGTKTSFDTMVSSFSSENASLQVDDTGNVLLAWRATFLTNEQAFVARVTYSASQDVSVSQRISVDSTVDGDREGVSVAIQDASNFVVVWTGREVGGTNDVFARQFGTGAEQSFQFSTESVGNSQGVDFNAGSFLSLSDPNFSLQGGDPVGTTTGTVSELSSVHDFNHASGAEVGVQSLHVVTRDLVIGKDDLFFQLLAGDIIFTVDATTTFFHPNGINTITADANDILIRRPIGVGEIDSGEQFVLFDAVAGVNEFNAITLVEQDTVIGDTNVAAGSFLFTTGDQGNDEDQSVWLWDISSQGVGFNFASAQELIVGSQVQINSTIDSLELFEYDTEIGGTVVAGGSLVLSLEGNGTVGNNLQMVENEDIAVATFTSTSLGATGNANAQGVKLFEGDSVGFGQGGESVNAVSLFGVQVSPPELTLDSATVTFVEDQAPVVVSPNATVLDPGAEHFNGGQLHVTLNGAGTANDRLTIVDSISGPEISVVGNSVHFNGDTDPFATFTGGTSHIDPLVVTFISDGATPLAVERLIENVAFSNVSDTPTIFNRTVQVRLTDSQGLDSSTETVFVSLQAVNDAPVLDASGSTELNDIFVNIPDDRNWGTSVAELLASSAGLTDVDSANLGIAITNVDSANGTWEFTTDGFNWSPIGAVSTSNALLLADDGATNQQRIRFIPNPTYTGNATIEFYGWDRTIGFAGEQNVDLTSHGFGGSSAFSVDSETATVFVDPTPNGELLFSTNASTNVGGTPWNPNDIVRFGGLTTTFAPGTTSGTFQFLGGFPTDIVGLHHVDTPTTVGTGRDSFTLLPGDVLMTFAASNFGLPGPDGTFLIEQGDIVVFRPSDGLYRMLLEGPITEGGTQRNIHAFTLVETDTEITPGTTIQEGSFLIARSNDDDGAVEEHLSIYVYNPTEVAAGQSGNTSQGIDQLLLNGADLGLTSEQIQGLDLLEEDILLGDEMLTAGSLLLSIDRPGALEDGDGDAGTNLLTNSTEIVLLDIDETELEAGNTVASASQLFIGSDAGLNVSLDAFTLRDSVFYDFDAPPIADARAGGPHVIREGEELILDASFSFDPDTGTSVDLTIAWDLNNDGTYEITSTDKTATFTWAELVAQSIDDDGIYQIALRVTDPDGNSSVDVFDLTVENAAPTSVINGGQALGTGTEDVVYSITIDATDPGDDLITHWWIDWGDGTRELVEAAATYEHTYTRGGTYNILTAAVDEDGTHLQNDVAVPSFTNDGSVFIFDGSSGRQTAQFGASELDNPVQVVVGPNGNLFVSSNANNQVWEFTRDGLVVDSDPGIPGNQPFIDAIPGPAGLAFDANGDLWVSVMNSSALRRYHSGGFEEINIGVQATGLEFHPNGDLFFVSHTVDDSGQLHRLRDGVMTSFGALSEAEDIAISSDGNIFVSDAGNDQVQVFDVDGNLQDTIATFDGSGNPVTPYGLAFGPDGLLYITTDDAMGSSSSDQVIRYAEDEDSGTWSFHDTFTSGGSPAVDLDFGFFLAFLPEHQVNIAQAADTPTITPTTTSEETQSTTGLVVTPNSDDGSEVTHFQITGISGGTLYLVDGVTEVTNGSFISVKQGNDGLRFTPANNLNSMVTGTPIEFHAQASLTGDSTGLGGGLATAMITVTEVNDSPELTAGTINPVTATEDAGLVSLGLNSLNYGPGGANDEASQTLTYSIVSLPTSLGDVLLADGVTEVVVGTSYSLADLHGLQLRTALNANGADQLQFTVVDNGTTDGSLNPLLLAQTLDINISPVNDAPIITATPRNPTLIENGADVLLFQESSISTVESGQLIQSIELSVNDIVDGSSEFIRVDGTNVSLESGTSSPTTNGYVISVTNTGSSAVVVITRPGGIAANDAEDLINLISYANTMDDPGVSRSVVITSLTDDGGGTNDTSATNIVSDITITNINDAPELVATGATTTFIEDDTATSLFTVTSLDLIEAADRVQLIELTVGNLDPANTDFLIIDGDSIALIDGQATTTSAGMYIVDVTVAGNQAVVQITHASDIDPADAISLLTGAGYQSSSDDPLGNRTVTITRVEDNGGGATNVSVPNTLATIALVNVNDAPTVSANSASIDFIDGGSPVAVFTGAAVSPLESGDGIHAISLNVDQIADGPNEVLWVDGTAVTLLDGVSATTLNGFDIDVSVSGSMANVVVTRTGSYSAAEAVSLIESLQYQNTLVVATGTQREIILSSIQDDGGTTNGGIDTTILDVRSTVNINAINDPPSLTATGGNVDYTENATGVLLFSGTTIDLVEPMDLVREVELTVSGLMNGADEILNVDGSPIALVDGSHTTLAQGIDVSVAVSGTTATITLSRTNDVAVADMQTIIDSLSYQNTADVIGTSRTVTLTRIQDNGGGMDTTALNIVSNINITPVNDSPVLATTAENPVYTEGGTSVQPFSGTTIDLIEPGDLVQRIELTFVGLANGVDEVLRIDGDWRAIITSVFTTPNNQFRVNIDDTTGVVSIEKLGGGAFDVTEAETLIDTLEYGNSSQDPLGASREVIVSLIQDDGGGTDTSTPDITSTITIQAVNDAPVVTTVGLDPTFREDDPTVTLFDTATIDAIESGQNVSVIHLTIAGAANAGEEFVQIAGQEIVLADGSTMINGDLVVSVTGGGTAIQIESAAGLSTVDAATLIEQIGYRNSSVEPTTAARVFTLTVTDSGGTASMGEDTSTTGIASTVDVISVNDEPTFTATAVNPSHTEDGNSVLLFENAVVDVIEGSQQIQEIQLTVSGLLDGTDEILIVDGTAVELISGSQLTTNGYDVSVAVASDTAAVVVSRTTGITNADLENLINGLSYQNTSDAQLDGTRQLTITNIVDDGGIANGGDDTHSPGLVSTIDVIAVNDRPTIMDAVLAPITEDDFNGPGETVQNLFAAGFADPDGSSDSLFGVAVVENTADPTTQGVWQYTTNGTSWFDIGTVDATNALGLSSGTQVRFVPVADFNGSPPSLVVHAIDSSYVGAFSETLLGEIRALIDTTSTLADEPYSSATSELTTSVLAANDTPEISGVSGTTVNDNAEVTPFSSVQLTDIDGDAVEVSVTLAGGDINGLLTPASLAASGFVKTGDGVYTLAPTSTAVAEAALRQLAFAPTENQVASGQTAVRSFTIDVNDGTLSATNSSTNVTVVSINDAPTVTANGVLAAIQEDEVDPPGATLDSLLVVDDVDFGASFDAVAIIDNVADPVTEGAWQYSSDGGTTWFDVGSVDATNALVVQSDSILRFVPIADYNGTPAPISLHVIDDSYAGTFSTTAGGEIRVVIDASTPTVTGSISSAVAEISTSVDAVNDAPEISGTVAGTTVDDNAQVTPFGSVQFTDIDADAIAVEITLVGGDLNGQFTAGSLANSGFAQTGDGVYTLASASIAAAEAAIQQLTFDPAENQVASGQTITHSFQIDATDGALSVSDTVTSVVALSVNDAPVIAAAQLPAVNEDNFNPSGQTIAALFGSSVTDVDTSSVLSGVAIVGNAADAVNEGSWQYSSDGITWFDVGNVSDTNALAIENTSLLRFVPVADFQGTPTDLVLRGLDDFYSGVFSSTVVAESRQTIDTSNPKADSPFSALPANLSTMVTDTNDSPTIEDATLAAIDEDDTTSAGQTVGTLFASSFVDIDPGSSLDGIVVVQNSANALTEGAWQYSTDGINWYDIGNVDDSGNGLALDVDTLIRFSPVGDFNGTPTSLSVRGVDNTFTGLYSDASETETRQSVDTSSVSVTQSFSTSVARLQADVTPVNDAPTLENVSTNVLSGETFNFSVADFQNVSADVEGDILTAIFVTRPANGTLVTNPDGSFSYIANDGFIGVDTFQWQAQDAEDASEIRTFSIEVAPAVIIVSEPTESNEPDEVVEDEEAESETETETGSEVIAPLIFEERTVDSGGPPSSVVDVLNVGSDDDDQVSFFERSIDDLPTSRDAAEFVSRSTSRKGIAGDGDANDRDRSRNLEELQSSGIDFAILAGPGKLWTQLDAAREQQNSVHQGELIKLGTTGTVVSGFTVGFVAWALRGGFLLSGMLAQMPAWKSVDPLLIMQGLEGDGEGLEEIIESESDALDASEEG